MWKVTLARRAWLEGNCYNQNFVVTARTVQIKPGGWDSRLPGFDLPCRAGADGVRECEVVVVCQAEPHTAKAHAPGEPVPWRCQACRPCCSGCGKEMSEQERRTWREKGEELPWRCQKCSKISYPKCSRCNKEMTKKEKENWKKEGAPQPWTCRTCREQMELWRKDWQR